MAINVWKNSLIQCFKTIIFKKIPVYGIYIVLVVY